MEKNSACVSDVRLYMYGWLLKDTIGDDKVQIFNLTWNSYHLTFFKHFHDHSLTQVWLLIFE